MDIWSWVSKKEALLKSQGEHRLAELMDEIPSYTCDNRHHKVAMLMPEALQHARRLKDKHVELFLRHWNLQSQVLHRKNAKGLIDEAVSLLDFSHRPETQNCPQRICVVQDLAACYGTIYGPGYAQERIDVCEQTIEEIDPSWPCFKCISVELHKAMCDKGLYTESLQSIRNHQQLMLEAGSEHPCSDFAMVYTQILIKNEQFQDALQMITQAQAEGAGSAFYIHKRILTALVHTKLGNFEEALQELPTYEQIEISPAYYEDWIAVQKRLFDAGKLDVTGEALRLYHMLTNRLRENGAIRMALECSFRIASMSMETNHLFSCAVALERAKALMPELVKDDGASATYDNLQSQLAAKIDTHNKDVPSIDDIQSPFQFDERVALYCYGCVNKGLGEGVHIVKLAKAYEYYAFADKGEILFEQVYSQSIADPEIRFEYAKYLIENHFEQKFFDTFSGLNWDELDQNAKLDLHILFSHAHKETIDIIRHCKAALGLDNSLIPTRVRLAKCYMKLEQYSEALLVYQELMALEPEELCHCWDVITAATIEQQWELVRSASQKIGIELTSDSGPVVENFEHIYICFDPDDEETTYLARRTGPVTARIVNVASLAAKQYFNHEVVFDPAPLNELDQIDDDGDKCDELGRCAYVYSAIVTTKSPNYFLFFIEGVSPPPEQKNALIDELINNCCVFSQRSTEEYTVHWVEGDKEREAMGLYAYILVEESHSLQSVRELLERHIEGYEHPLIYPGLLDELGDWEGLEKHAELEQYYDL